MMSRIRSSMVCVFLLCVLLAAGTISVFGQTERWMFTYDGPAHLSDTFPSTVFGGDGNIYSTGYGGGSEANIDIFVVSVDPAGNQRWVYTYDNGGHDGANAVVYGPDGHLYVVGASAGPPSDNVDLVVICLDTAGTEQWVYRYDGPAGVVDNGHDIHLGVDGNLYVVGYSGGIGTQYDALVLSLTPGGILRWVYRYDGAAGSHDRAYRVTSGHDNMVYIAGYSKEISQTELFTVIALDTGGQEKWVYLESAGAGNQNAARSLAFAPDGHLLAAGTSDNQNFTVVKLDWKRGVPLWHYAWPTSSKTVDRANAMVCGDDGYVYVAGTIEVMLTMNDFVVVSLDGDGNQRWVYRHNGSENQWDEAWSLIGGLDGELYAAGQCHSTVSGRDALVVSLDTDGSVNWTHTINGSAAGSDDGALSAVFGADGHLYVGGFVSNHTGRDLALVKIDTDNTVSAEIEGNPAAGALPLETMFFINVANNCREETRNVSARVDLTLAGGQAYSGWRSGYMNIRPGDAYQTLLPAVIPLSSATTGENRFQLVVQDTTPSPYNQPPYAPSGDTDTDLCIVTGY